MTMNQHGDGARRRAAGLWLAAAMLYVGSELAAASAFSPTYSYARNYISDLGVTSCSPLHGLMNGDLVVQGLLFPGAALAIARSCAPGRLAFLALAVLNGVGNVLLGCFPENMPGRFAAGPSCHVVGALLAIACGNAAALVSAWSFAGLGLSRIHRRLSLGLPLAAAASLAVLIAARGAGTAMLVPDAVWERISVYAITAWEVLTAACLVTGTRRR